MMMMGYYPCPWTFVRSNYVSQSNFDGGKWTCGVSDMYEQRKSMQESNTPCIVYSFGSNDDDFFEKRLLEADPQCEIHVFDPTTHQPPSHSTSLYHFHKEALCVGNRTSTWIKGKTYPCKSLSNHMRHLGHAYVDIMKADVDGMEWSMIPLEDWQSLQIGQLQIEFHFSSRYHRSPRTMVDLFQKHIIPLEQAGFFIGMVEPVAARAKMQYEVMFLNANWSPAGFKHNFNASMYPVTPNVQL
eukprot:gnl/TRDRNA2_/TRDRNA2_172522_c0_seq4.p1 gnl/TRDRNA2_/TRDRNA2_172522_c0~~gnl/TRDRNA2_/TRDRNA2_172522_c0_seq4.p1  ORF type:complete len:242 (-),score=25.18 gnl/TRDRNA2_/TRDRNA2_172522_c0_seq4:104-829(-)